MEVFALPFGHLLRADSNNQANQLKICSLTRLPLQVEIHLFEMKIQHKFHFSRFSRTTVFSIQHFYIDSRQRNDNIHHENPKKNKNSFFFSASRSNSTCSENPQPTKIKVGSRSKVSRMKHARFPIEVTWSSKRKNKVQKYMHPDRRGICGEGILPGSEELG